MAPGPWLGTVLAAHALDHEVRKPALLEIRAGNSDHLPRQLHDVLAPNPIEDGPDSVLVDHSMLVNRAGGR